VAAFPLDSMFGLAQGFDVYDDYYSVGAAPDAFTIVERSGVDVVAAAREWIVVEQADRPWFAWVHLYEPHAPYEPPQPFADRYRSDLYAGEVAAVDAALAPLLADVVAPETLVIVTSDHGEGLGQHDELTHGLFAYDQTLRVPLILVRPGYLPGGHVVREWVRHIDLLPTVLDHLGLPAVAADGRSLVALIAGQADSHADDEITYFEALTPYLTRGWAPLRGLRRGSLKFIDLPIPELYDLSEDPGELENLALQDPRSVAAMRADLQDHLSEVEGGAITEVSRESAATLQRLRSLGYVGASEAPDPTRDFGPEDDPKNLVHLDRKIHEAVKASREQRWSFAEERLREVVTERPDFMRAHSLLASILYRQGGLADAIAHLEGVAQGELIPPEILNELGYYLHRAGRLERASEVLEASLAVEDPENPETLNLLGGVYEQLGQGEKALEAFRRGLEIDPTYASLNANYGTALLSLGRVDDAIAALRAALEYDPRLPEPHNALGVIAAQRDSLPLAVEHWRAAVDLDPDLFDALFNLGVALERLGRIEEAIPVLESFVARAPEDRYARDIEDMRLLLERLRQRQL
jgi:tetratricopeptide (TPR) repeat protein